MSATAAGHPLRVQILRALDGTTASPSELAAQLDQPLPTVSYHVAFLVDLEVLELVETRPVRGTLKHFYRARLELCECCSGTGVRSAGSHSPAVSTA